MFPPYFLPQIFIYVCKVHMYDVNIYIRYIIYVYVCMYVCILYICTYVCVYVSMYMYIVYVCVRVCGVHVYVS